MIESSGLGGRGTLGMLEQDPPSNCARAFSPPARPNKGAVYNLGPLMSPRTYLMSARTWALATASQMARDGQG